MILCKTFPVNLTAVAAGNGFWGMAAGTEVKFESIELDVYLEEDGRPYSAEVRAYHNADANSAGLCYTDKGIEDEVSAAIMQHSELSEIVDGSVCGSEQGMQGQFMLSCDADLRGSVTRESLEALGFK